MNRDAMQGEDFTQFLKQLATDPDEAGRRYVLLRQNLVAFFSRHRISDPDNAADETLDRAAMKIAEGAVVPEIKPYCLGIARYIVKERVRKEFRDDGANREFVHETINQSNEQVEWIYRVLLPCFQQLDIDEQRLLVEYCQVMHGRERAEHRRKLAEKRNTTLLGLRMRVTRIRTHLAECVKQRSQDVK
jgi:hypothetical protein